MPKITSRRNKIQYVDIERALIRDKSLKSTSKLLYCVFVSIAESNEGNVFPSYAWLADQVGYEYKPNVAKEDSEEAEANKERAMRKFIMQHLQPLIDRGLIQQTLTYSTSPDYEVIGYIDEREGTIKFSQSEQKSSLQSEQKSSPSNKSIRKKNIDTPISPTGELKNENKFSEEKENEKTPKPNPYPNVKPLPSAPGAEFMPTHINPMSFPNRASFEREVRTYHMSGKRCTQGEINDRVLEKWGEKVDPPPPLDDGITRDPQALERLKETNYPLYEKIKQSI